MPTPQAIEAAIKEVSAKATQAAFLQRLLIDTLQWPIDPAAKTVEETAFAWTADELAAGDLSQKLVENRIWQIQTNPVCPWGVFLLEFHHPDAFHTDRGLTGPLRTILRTLVPKARASALPGNRPVWFREHLLFICTHQYQHFRFAYFKAPEGQTKTAPLAAFGWSPDVPARTACEHNLPNLQWPEKFTPEAFHETWADAFNIEKVTRKFYEDYRAVFEATETAIGKNNPIQGDELRLFTQTLFNRLMFLRFIERKNWLTLNGRHDYLQALHDAAQVPPVPESAAGALTGGSRGPRQAVPVNRTPASDATFYQSRIRPLFFEGLAVEDQSKIENLKSKIGDVPFLNGGLFEESPLDRKVKDIPDTAFAPIIAASGLFYRFNFTVEESTPLDIEVAVDPEMLGKVFEELVTGRHESGSYFTPRPVVSFMCREALKGYLMDKLQVPPVSASAAGALTGGRHGPREALPPNAPADPPIENRKSKIENSLASLVDHHEVKDLTESHARHILSALDSLKAVDPACGSGAYLLGLLHELVALYRLLYSEHLVKDARSLYDLKLRIISHNLYGVDIDPFATNIAMLRLWLSLAVEADEPLPLPNLDFKIETGDSLAGPCEVEATHLDFHALRTNADALVDQKDRYLRAHGEEKAALKQVIQSMQQSIRLKLRSLYAENVIDWRVAFADVLGKNGGFDIVLANPPYVRNELISKPLKARLNEHYPLVADGKSDLYIFFYARGIELLRPGGIHIFICSNSWLDVGYGGKLQKHLLQSSHILSIHESAVERQFSTADVNTIITVIKKGHRADDQRDETRFVSLRAPFETAIAHPAHRSEVVRTRKQLWEAGLRPSSRGRLEYDGDKWGGKYLRAPDVYSVIMEKGAKHLRCLGEFFEGERYLNTGGADGFFILTDVQPSSHGKLRVRNAKVLDGENAFEGDIEREYLVPLVKDFTKQDKRIEIHGFDANCLVVNGTPTRLLQKYIAWGEEQGYHQRSVTKSQQPWYKPTNQMARGAKILLPRSFNDTFVIHYNPKEYLSLRFYRLHPRKAADEELVGFLNSTLVALFIETLGNKSLGQGVLDVFMADFLSMRIPVPPVGELRNAFASLKDRQVGSVYEECGLADTGIARTSKPQPQPDRKALDEPIFEVLKLTPGERDGVYEALVDMVTTRIQKAQSLNRRAVRHRAVDADDATD